MNKINNKYDSSKEIMNMAKINCELSPVETYQYPTPASRPHYSLLCKAKIKKRIWHCYSVLKGSPEGAL
jgi:dTDP-4-dehydrorhamnose reductase